ncbi:hypothetical protein GW916_00480 [bacterium]|nr:hypothetical protein [bacterium]
MKSALTALLVIVFLPSAYAERSDRSNSFGFELGVGSGAAKIKNLSQGDSNYEAFSFRGRLNFPLIVGESYGFALLPGYRFSSLENSANNSQVETGKLEGFGAGIHLRLFKFYFGYELYQLSGGNQFVGTTSSHFEYEMLASNLVAGLLVPLKSAAILIEYNQLKGEIPSSATGLAEASSYSDGQFWINLRYNTDFEMGSLFGFLFD